MLNCTKYFSLKNISQFGVHICTTAQNGCLQLATLKIVLMNKRSHAKRLVQVSILKVTNCKPTQLQLLLLVSTFFLLFSVKKIGLQ